MKRCETDDLNDASIKRCRSEPQKKFELRLLISTKAAGAVIGRGGDYIKMLREMHEATFFIPDSSPERVLMVLVNLRNLEACIRDMLVRLSEDSKEEDEIETKILVHQSHAGAIIGHSGENIFMLKNKMNAKLKVYKDCCPNSTDRIVLVTTSKNNMPLAIKFLADFLNENPIKGVQKPYDAINYDSKLALKYGGFLIGDHEIINGTSRNSCTNFPSTSDDFSKSHISIVNRKSVSGNESKHTAKVTIPSKLGGLIVGKGGTSINRIRSESNARIDIDQSDNEHETSVTIIGDLSQIHKALYLLQHRIVQSGISVQLSVKFDLETIRNDVRQG
uniref:K Homology domain-containing protein n=1 Tax=Acrobeloides nanus TaxID=290746 RepID=A0A914EGB0_9BILA